MSIPRHTRAVGPGRLLRAALALALAIGISVPLRAQEAGTALAGTWRGSYVCAQGRTALTLVIEGAAGAVAARFEFSAHPSNPGVPSGAFTMAGRFDPKTRRLALRPLSWVERPPDYLMVGLTGNLSADGASISGTVETEGCSTFEVARAGK